MKSIKKTPIVFSLLSLIAFFAFAKQEKVLQIFRNGEVIQEYAVNDIDYIEVNDIIPTPADVNASVSNDQITIKWNPVEGARYNIYRSPDNVEFSLIVSDLTETSFTDLQPLPGTNYYRVTAIIDGRESKYADSTVVTISTEQKPSGIYLGITGFSRGFQSQPIKYLSSESMNEFQSFVNNLTATESHTWLYYAVEKSIDNLKRCQFPADLSEVAIVTFTDGVDVGSLDEKEKEEPIYSTTSQYRDALNARLNTEQISNINISAYTIGVLDGKTSSLSTFRSNMSSLATSSANVYEVEKIESLNQVFEQIANSLSETEYVQQFVLAISGLGEGDLCRFTFDNVSSYRDSKLYIEGTYRRKDKALTDIKYVGLTSSSGPEVVGVYDDETGKYEYTFKGLKATDGALIPTTKVQHWFTDENVWQDVDDEFFFNPDDATIEKNKRSAAIMLNLDCSKSMEGMKLSKLKDAVDSFILKLAENSIDPFEVSSVSLDKHKLILAIGKETFLNPTVLPTTAKLKTVTWSSSDPSVASVDETGKVTALCRGKTIITVTTQDGGYTDSCEVEVITPISSIAIYPSSKDLNVNDDYILSTVITPDNADIKDVIWSSSDENIVEVDSDGRITSKKGGKAVITASTCDGTNLSSTCEVFVHQEVNEISFSSPSLTLCLQDKKVISPIFYPEDATELDVIWTSSDESIFTVNEDGEITSVSTGTADLIVSTANGEHQATCKIEVEPAVNLGLSVPWATFNLGAASEEDYGKYYAWGETTGKTSFTPGNYKWLIYYSESEMYLTKYNSNSKWGLVDNKRVLDDNDDAAYIMKGRKWRIPSDEQWAELRQNCTWTWTTQNGKKGYLIKSNKSGYTDRSIFLPAAGGYDSNGANGVGISGIYWTNEIYDGANAFLEIFSQTSNTSYKVARFSGCTIRPVLIDY